MRTRLAQLRSSRQPSASAAPVVPHDMCESLVIGRVSGSDTFLRQESAILPDITVSETVGINELVLDMRHACPANLCPSTVGLGTWKGGVLMYMRPEVIS